MCGLFCIRGHEEAAILTALGLHALQHRGQDAVGVVSFDDVLFHSFRDLGLVGEKFGDHKHTLERLPGRSAIGHTLYTTAVEKPEFKNIQPLFSEMPFGGFALGHNGNLENAQELRKELIADGCLFQTTTDTEVFMHLVARAKCRDVTDRLWRAFQRVKGSYALVALTEDAIYGARDPLGMRPLVVGEFEGADILASETAALDIMGARFVRDVKPGEIVCIRDGRIHSLSTQFPPERKFCIFEYIYFARPDSVVEGTSVYEARKRAGARLALEHKEDIRGDVVVPAPDSGVAAAIGFSQETGIPFELGLIRNHYVGRTFIEPTDLIRNFGAKLKHNANRSPVAGKRVILVDDSIMRGTTSTKLVQLIRDAGATEVHVWITCPPTMHGCFWGMAFAERAKLLAARMKGVIAHMCKCIGADSLHFLSLGGMTEAVGGEGYCDHCWTGTHPAETTKK